MSDPIRFLIAEAHPLVNHGLRGIVSQVPGYSVVGETGDGTAVVELAAQLEPAVILLAVALPNRSGLELLAPLRKRGIEARVILLAEGDDDKTLRQALTSGAAGYLLKSVTAEELHLAIRTVLRGYRYVSVELADRIFSEYERGYSTRESVDGRPVRMSLASAKVAQDEIPLTRRQCEVLRLMACGYDNHQIGDTLGISPRTVETHRAGLMQKLGCTTAFAVVRYALQRGLLSLDE